MPNYTAMRRHAVEWRALVERCRVKLAEARAALGADLGGHSAVDLLLDNFSEIRDSGEARRILSQLRRTNA